MKSNLHYINRIKINGNWEFDELFENGIIGIHADNQRGKTTLIDLIFKGLGINDRTDDICNQNVKELYIEYKLNEKKFTVKNDFRGKKRSVYLNNDWVIDTFNDDKSKKIKLSDLKDLIETEFNINEYMRRDGTTMILNNLGQCYRAFYLIQGTIRDIIARLPDIRRIVVRSLLRRPDKSNIFKDERIDLKKKRGNIIKKLDLEKLNLKTNLASINDILSKYKILDVEKRFNIKNLPEFINEKVKEQVINILNEKRLQKNEANEDFTKKIDPREIEKKTELIELDNKIEKLNLTKQEVTKELGGLIEKANISNEEIDKIELSIIEINRKIEEKDFSITVSPSGLKVKICPRCFRMLTKDMYQREKEVIKKCAMCYRELIVKPEIAKEDLLKSKELKEKEKDNLLNIYNKFNENIKITEEKIAEINRQITKYYDEKKEIRNKLIDTFQEDLKKSLKGYDELKDKIHSIQTDLRSYNSYEKSFNNFNKLIPELKEVNDTLKKIKSEKVFEEEVEIFWLDAFKYFMEQIMGETYEIEGFKENTAEINFKNKKKLADHERNMTTVGYYYAFLKTSLNYPIKYPKIVFLDCFATEELIASKVVQIIEIFKKLYDDNKQEEFQVFLVTASPEILKYEKEFRILKATMGNYLFNAKGVE